MSARRGRWGRWRGSVFWKTAVVSAVVIGMNVVGNYALGRGLHAFGSLATWSPTAFLRAMQQPWVAVGVAFMIGWVASRLALLSWADLSYALPVTAVSYALTALVGEEYLAEHVSVLHWGGIVAITLGAVVVAVTNPETTQGPDKPL